MRHNTIITKIMMWGAFAGASLNLSAQSFSLEYDTEWQTDFKGGYDWLNYLQLNASLPLCDHLQIHAETLSTAKTGESTLIDDMLTYSNIEAGNMALTIARLGLGIEAGKSSIFVGINNVNEDYFTSDYTSFFTNSSCGITPTLSCNYDIANFPLSSWGLYYGIQLGEFKLQTSLYPGQARSRIFGRDNLFTFNLKADGVFSISSLEYQHSNIYCCLGAALFDGVCIYDQESADASEALEEESLQAKAPRRTPGTTKAYPRRAFQSAITPLNPYTNSLFTPIHSRSVTSDNYITSGTHQSPKKKFSFTPWILTEINLPANFGLLLHGSFSTVSDGCKAYAGLGVLYDIKDIRSGISFNYASFTGENECDIELSSQIPVYLDKATIQPALHIVTKDPKEGDSHMHCIGMVRFTLNI